MGNINLSGYSGDDPTLRLGKRVKLLNQAFPEFADRPELLNQLAQSELDDGELIRQTADLSGIKAFAETRQALEAQDRKTQREIFRKLPAITQASLMKSGYSPPSRDYNEGSLSIFGINLGWDSKRKGILGNVANALETPFALGAYGVHSTRQLGGALVDLQNVGSNIVKQGYRAISAHGETMTQPYVEGDVSTGYAPANQAEYDAAIAKRKQQSEQFLQATSQSRLAEAVYWLDQNVKLGNLSQTDAARIAAKGEDSVVKWYQTANDDTYVKGLDRLRAYSGSWGDAWHGTSAAGRSFRPKEILVTREHLGYDFGKINLAERIASGDKPEELLAERGIVIGTNEYRSELAKLQEEINDPKMKDAVNILKSGIMNWGADLAKSYGIKEGTPAFALATGVFDAGLTLGLDPSLPVGKALKIVRAARYGIDAGQMYDQIGRVRTVLASADAAYKNADGTRKAGLALLAARDEVTRARAAGRAVDSVVDAWNTGGRSFHQLLTEQPQLAPLISFARKAATSDGRLTSESLWDALQTDSGVATILQGSSRMYRKTPGMGALPRIDMFNAASGEIRGVLSRGIDMFVDYKIAGKAKSAEAITARFGTGLAASNAAFVAGKFERALAYVPTTAAQVAKLGVKVPYRSYVNLEDMSSIKEMLNMGSLVGIGSEAQAKVLDDLIRGTAGIADQAASLAAARSVVTGYLQGLLVHLGIPDAAKKVGDLSMTEMRQHMWANEIMQSIGKAYDVTGDRLGYLASHASNNIAIPNVTDLARAAQNHMFMSRMYRFINPWWLESGLAKWRAAVTIAPRMGLRAGAEEALTFILREGPGKYLQAVRASSIYAPERISTLERLANEAQAAGQIEKFNAYMKEADRLRKMPGTRAIANGIEWLTQLGGAMLGPRADQLLDPVARFTSAVANHTTSVVRRAMGAALPITDEQIALGAKLWATDESAMALASVVDGRHMSIESPWADAVGSVTDVKDNAGNILDVSMTGGRGFRLVPTSTDDLIQTMNRMAQMTQHARDPFVEQVMRKLAGAHTEVERQAILGAFTSADKFTGASRNKQFRAVFSMPNGLAEEEKFDWAINRFREVIGQMHPSVREDFLTALRSDLYDTGRMNNLEQAQKAASEAGNFQLSQQIGREISANTGVTNRGTAMSLNVRQRIVDNRSALDEYRVAWGDFEIYTKKLNKQAQANLRAAIKAQDASLMKGGGKQGKNLATRIIDDLKTGNPKKSTVELVGSINRRPNSRKSLTAGYNNWKQWDTSLTNYFAVDRLTNGLDLRFKELLTYDGQMTRISGSGSYALRGWFQGEVLTPAAKNGLFNNQELASQMDRMLRVPYTNGTGQEMIGTVVRPLAENRIGIYWPLVDEQVSTSLYGTMGAIENLVKQGVDRETAIDQIINNLMMLQSDGSYGLPSSRQRYILKNVFQDTNYDGVWAHMQSAKATGRGMMPFANISYANHDVADEVNRTLNAAFGSNWIDEGKSIVGTIDITTPKGVINHPGWKPGGLLNREFIPADSEVGTLPKRLAGSNVYATPDHLIFKGEPINPATAVTLADGTVTNGFTREEAMQAFAQHIASTTLDRFTSPDGAILHDVIHGILRDETDLYQRVSNLTSKDLPAQSVVPSIYLQATMQRKPGIVRTAAGKIAGRRGLTAEEGVQTAGPGIFSKLAEMGYNKAVSPLIAGISRQPMFIASLGEAADVAQQWRKSVLALSVKEQEIAALFKARGIPFDNVAKAWDALGAFEQRPGVNLKKMMTVFEENGVTLTDLNEAKAVRDTLSYMTHINRLEKNIAYERAFNNILPYIDDHNIKTFASTYMRGMVPFMYAEEQFMRRWLRTLIDNPFALHRAQMYLGTLRTVGLVEQDPKTGEDMFIYPLVPAFAEFLGKFPVVGKLLFGDGGRLPNGVSLKGVVSESIPGFKNPGQILPGPAFSVPMTLLRHFTGQGGAVVDDMIESATGRRPQEGTVGDDLLLGLLPGYASRLVKMGIGIAHGKPFLDTTRIDSSEELARTSIQAAQMFGAEGQSYLRKANDAKAAGDMEGYRRYKEKAAELLPPNETDDAVVLQHYSNMIQSAARKIMFSRVLTGFFGLGTSYERGEQYEMSAKFSEYLKAIDPSDPDGYSKAMGKFLTRYPDALPYTVQGTVSASRAPVSMTGNTNLWMKENAAILEKAPLGASWLIPPDVEGERDPRVWGRLRALGLRKQRSLDEWAIAFNVAASSQDFSRNKDKFDKALAEYNDNADVKRALKAAWAQWRNDFDRANPVFAQERSSGNGRTRRQNVMSQILSIEGTPEAPTDEYAQAIFSIARSYDAYQRALQGIAGNTKQDDAVRSAVRSTFWKWGASKISEDVALAGFWNGIVVPDAFPSDYNPYSED